MSERWDIMVLHLVRMGKRVSALALIDPGRLSLRLGSLHTVITTTTRATNILQLSQLT